MKFHAAEALLKDAKAHIDEALRSVEEVGEEIQEDAEIAVREAGDLVRDDAQAHIDSLVHFVEEMERDVEAGQLGLTGVQERLRARLLFWAKNGPPRVDVT